MTTISNNRPELKVTTNTPQHISSDKAPLKIDDHSFYGNTMVGGSSANSLNVAKDMVIRTLSQSTSGVTSSTHFAGLLGMAVYHAS